MIPPDQHPHRHDLARSGKAIPQTGGWQSYQTVRSRSFYLNKGRHIMQLVMDREATTSYVGNIDALKLTRVVTP